MSSEASQRHPTRKLGRKTARQGIRLSTGGRYKFVIMRGRTIEYQLKPEAGGVVRPHLPFVLKFADGTQRHGVLDVQGFTRQPNCPEGAYTFDFPHGKRERPPEMGWLAEDLALEDGFEAGQRAELESWKPDEGRVIEYQLKPEAGGVVRPHLPFVLKFADGTQRHGVLDGQGFTRQPNCPEGAYTFDFPHGTRERPPEMGWLAEDLALEDGFEAGQRAELESWKPDEGRVIEYQLKPEAGGVVRPHLPFVLKFADGTQRHGVLDGQGFTRQPNCPEGAYTFDFPHGKRERPPEMSWLAEDLVFDDGFRTFAEAH